MSWPEDEWGDYGAEPDEPISLHWPLDWRGLCPSDRWLWFEQLWNEVCMLRDRYRLAIRSGWWENELQLETLAALSGWVSRYDSGEWDDPPGKLALLYDLERVNGLLKDGRDPFSPARDRSAFIRHLLGVGCQPPPQDCDLPAEHNGHRPAETNGYEPPPSA